MFESEKILGTWYWLKMFVQKFSFVTNLDHSKQLAMPPSQIYITKWRRSSIKQLLLGFAESLANTVSAWMQNRNSIFHSRLLVEVHFKFDLPGVWDGVWLIKNLRLRMHYYLFNQTFFKIDPVGPKIRQLRSPL